MKHKILIVDDEEDTRLSVKTILEKDRYRVITAGDGEECIKKLVENPALILLDIMMPGMTTNEILQAINKFKATQAKIIFLTAVHMSEDEKQKLMKTKNIVDFIEKPFDIHDLLRRIGKALA